MGSSRVKTALVLGAGSDIAVDVIRRLTNGSLSRVMLASREPDRLRERLAQWPLPISDSSILHRRWDATDIDDHEKLMAEAQAAFGDIDLVLCAVGSLGHGAGLGAGPADVADLVSANFTGPAAALSAAATMLRVQGHGQIVVITSIAGLRARRSNFVYGAAKAGLDAFAAGLADAVAGTHVFVHVIRPGFVRTRMTVGLKPAPFSSDPAAVTDAIEGALAAGRSTVVHVPGLLGPMFGALRLAPRPIWRRIAGDR